MTPSCLTLLACALLAATAVLAERKNYSGYQILRTAALDATSLGKLDSLLQRPEFMFWSQPRVGSPVEIMASPEHVSLLRSALAGLGLQPTVLVPDVGVIVENERAEIEQLKTSGKSTGRAPALDRYLDYEEIQAYLDEVVAAFPAIATLVTIGSSYEGRPMRVLKLSNGPGKTGIWFDAAIHAREWAAPPVALNAINELTENLAANQAMLDKNDFYFLPVANPDGYSYTWTDDRFWRKSRSPNSGSICVGTDLNRNFDIHWAEEGTGGPCSDTYSGSAPFSEPEVKAVSDFLTNNPSITFYTALHSHGQLMLTPWSWTTDLPADYPEMKRVGDEAAAALQAIRDTRYQVGTSANILYYSYGNSKDWAYGGLNILFSYTIELPAGGSGSFNPPPSDILPVVTETWEAIKVFANNIPASRG